MAVGKSVNVAAGDTILAVHHNFLREDSIKEVKNKTANYIVSITEDYNDLITNLGASGDIEISLPSCEVDAAINVLVAADGKALKIQPASGDTIEWVDGSITSSEFLESSDIGSTVKLIGLDNDKWLATIIGTWTETT